MLVDPLGLSPLDIVKGTISGVKEGVTIVGNFPSHVEFWTDQARRGAQRGGALGDPQLTLAWAADFAISPFADISHHTETLWDTCASGWDKTKALGGIAIGIASLTPTGRAARAGAAAKAGAEAVETTGQLHHVISTRIGRELERNPNLAGRYSPRDPRFATRAVDDAAHRGYQTWHRELDAQVEGWLRANRNATPQQFESFLSLQVRPVRPATEVPKWILEQAGLQYCSAEVSGRAITPKCWRPTR